MTDPAKAATIWAEALSSPEHDTEALSPLLSETVVTVSALGTTEGKTAVLESFGQSPIAAFFPQGKWTEPAVDGQTARQTCTFPRGAPVGGVTVQVTLDSDGLIGSVETGVIQAAPPEPTAVELDDEIRTAIDGALGNGTPVVVAYVDDAGQPHLSLRGTVQVLDGGTLALWIRNPEGGLLKGIQGNPKLALMYRSSQPRATYQFHGRARRDDTPEVRDRVYDNSPEVERNFDPQRGGVAVVVDVDRVEGRDSRGPVRMAREQNSPRT